MALTSRTIADSGPVVLITHPRDSLLVTGPAHVVQRADVARARIWSAESVGAVLWSHGEKSASVEPRRDDEYNRQYEEFL